MECHCPTSARRLQQADAQKARKILFGVPKLFVSDGFINRRKKLNCNNSSVFVQGLKRNEIYAYGFVGDEVFADGKAHATAETKRGSDGAADDAVSAHDLGRHVA